MFDKYIKQERRQMTQSHPFLNEMEQQRRILLELLTLLMITFVWVYSAFRVIKSLFIY